MSKKFSAPKNFKATANASQIIAIILTVASILSLFLPTTAVFDDGMQTKFFALFTASATGMVGVVSAIARFGYILLALATAALAMLAIVKSDESEIFLPYAALTFLVGTGGYSLSVMACALSFNYFAVDVVTLLLSLVAIATLVYLALQKNEELFFANIAQFALTLGYTILMALSLGTVLSEEGFLGILVLLLLVLVCVNMVYECRWLGKEKNTAVDKIRFYAEVGAGALLFLLTIIGTSTITGILFSVLALAFALGQMETVNSKLRAERRKNVYTRPKSAFDKEREFAPAMDATASPFARPMPMPSPMAASVDPASDYNGFRIEEYAEAVPYEGGPISGVQMAEEVNPTFNPNPNENQAYTAGYDFYNSKCFDPFIASLDNEERSQFTELFILKYKGVMPEIPDYEVGGDNKEFFRKIFIYLGQYRDRIPSKLLAKIYSFSIKLS